MTIETTGSYDGEFYSLTICGDSHCTTLEGLTRKDVEEIADLSLCLLFDEREEYTWHTDFQPNDVY